MKIAFINDTFGTGSIGRLTRELAESLINRGHDVAYLYVQGNSNAAYSTKISTRNKQKVHAILSRITGLQGYFSYSSTHELIRRLEDFHPDIVHLQNLHSNYINLRMIGNYLKSNDIATVITLHDCWFFTGKCTYFIASNCNKWRSECRKCPQLHSDNVNPTFFFDTTHKCLTDKKNWFAENKRLGVVGVSHWITEEARKSIYKYNKIACIYNWVDQDVFYYRENVDLVRLKLPLKKIVLMVSTNLSEIKGYKELVYLSNNLSKEFQLVFIGKNKDNLSIPKSVIHIKHIDCAEQLAEYYSIANVCVNTTKYETFGMVTAEAISCGTPVVVYNNTASPELVGNGCGAVVGSMDTIVGAIYDITTQNRDEIRKACIQWSKSIFDKESRINEYVKFYEDLIFKDIQHEKRN